MPKTTPIKIGVPEPPATPAEIQTSVTNVATIAQISERCADHALGEATLRAVGGGVFGAGVGAAEGGIG
jgi:hypothetical protein